MSGRSFRGFLLLGGIVALGWWIHEKRPTLSGMIDDLTRPLFGSQAAVKESEHKRIVGEATQIVSAGEEKPVGTLYEGMSEEDVRRVIGDPDKIEPIEDERGDRTRWIYRRMDRVIVIRNHRVVSIAIQ
ncbi:MAG TPA: hypothetical protein VIY96_10770 [Thermoanaerobaculia bacterium]